MSLAAAEPRTFSDRERPRLDPVTIDRHGMGGDVLGRVTLDPEWFSVAVNVPLLHQVVVAQLAGRRAGTQSTKTRAEVAGGSKKPYRQKGTGNARQGSIRAPHYAGGGIALGPKPRSYAQKTPQKMIRQALRCALSDRAASGDVLLVDGWTFEVPRTRDAAAALAAIGCRGSVLVVLSRDEVEAAKSFANLPYVATVPLDQLTAYDVLSADQVLFSDATLPGEVTEGAPAPARASRAGAPERPAAETGPVTAEAAGAEEAEAAALEAPEVEAAIAVADAGHAGPGEDGNAGAGATGGEADGAGEAGEAGEEAEER